MSAAVTRTTLHAVESTMECHLACACLLGILIGMCCFLCCLCMCVYLDTECSVQTQVHPLLLVAVICVLESNACILRAYALSTFSGVAFTSRLKSFWLHFYIPVIRTDDGSMFALDPGTVSPKLCNANHYTAVWRHRCGVQGKHAAVVCPNQSAKMLSLQPHCCSA